MSLYDGMDRLHVSKSALEGYPRQGLQSIGCVRYAGKVGLKIVLLCSSLDGGSCIEDRASRTMVSIDECTEPKGIHAA